MLHRKRLPLIMCLVLAGAIGLFLWNTRSRPPAVSISFVGYTNRLVTMNNFPTGEVALSKTITNAVLRATNSGPVSVKVWGINTFEQLTNYPGFWGLLSAD